MPHPLVNIAALRALPRAAAERTLAARPIVRAALIPDVRAEVAPAVASGDAAPAAPESRTIPFVISTAAVDRMGDTIAVDGWQLDAYRKNPVVLWSHDSTQPPVGRATDVSVRDGALRAVAEFMPADVSPFAESVFRMYRLGFLRAVSVGFVPLKWAWVDTKERAGIDFLEQELLEFSCVPVPANAEALVEPDMTGTARGVDPAAAAARRRAIEIARAGA